MGLQKRKYSYRPASATGLDGTPQSSIYRKYRATIKIKGAKIALGSYDDEVEAAKAFDRAAMRYRGSRADVNFPNECKPPAKRKKADKVLAKAKSGSDGPLRMGLRSKSKSETPDSLYPDSTAADKEDAGCKTDKIEKTTGRKFLPLFSPFSVAAASVNEDLDEVAEALHELEEDCFEEDCRQKSETADSIPAPDARDNCQSQHAEDSSHGLSLLKSRFQLYRFDSSTASTYGPSTCLQDLERQHSVKQQLPRIPSAQLDMGRNASGEYRHMFMSRAYAERGCSMGSELDTRQRSEPSSITCVAPVHFEDEELAERREAWWRRQMQLTQERELLFRLGR